MDKFGIKIKGIVRYQDKYLIVNRWYDDRIVDPYQWEFIDAYVNAGDSMEDTILDAIKEVTGQSVEISRMLYSWNYYVGEEACIGIAYICDAVTDIVMLSENLVDYKWVSLDKFKEYITYEPLYSDVMNAFKNIK